MTNGRSPENQDPALRSGIHSALLDRLTTAGLAPGTHLSIDGLAREFGVSPTPVREALVALERTGLITYRARRGYIVAPPLNSEQIRELFDARLVLERAALSRALSRNWAEFSPELRAAHLEHVETAEAIRTSKTLNYKEVNRYFDADLAFHHAFFKHAENHFLAKLHEDLGTHGHRMRNSFASGRQNFDMDETIPEHYKILKRVEERNHDGALIALEEHLLNGCARFNGPRDSGFSI